MAPTDAAGATFCTVAEAFCDWAKTDTTGADANEARVALHLLADLYAAALKLPTSPPCGREVEALEVNEDEWKRLYARFGSLPFNYYGALEEPHTDLPGEATVGDLADDLADIYRDIKNGLSLWSAGHRVEAVWKWRDDFRFHWGRHAADAIQALHVWLERERKL